MDGTLQKGSIIEPVMIIIISRSRPSAASDFAAARGDWPANEDRLNRWLGKHYVLAENNGVFVDIFKPAKWAPVPTDDGKKRMRFDNEKGFEAGSPEYDELYKKYCNKKNGFRVPGNHGFRYVNMP